MYTLDVDRLLCGSLVPYATWLNSKPPWELWEQYFCNIPSVMYPLSCTLCDVPSVIYPLWCKQWLIPDSILCEIMADPEPEAPWERCCFSWNLITLPLVQKGREILPALMKVCCLLFHRWALGLGENMHKPVLRSRASWSAPPFAFFPLVPFLGRFNCYEREKKLLNLPHWISWSMFRK